MSSEWPHCVSIERGSKELGIEERERGLTQSASYVFSLTKKCFCCWMILNVYTRSSRYINTRCICVHAYNMESDRGKEDIFNSRLG